MKPVLTTRLQETTETIYYRPAVSVILPFEPKMNAKSDLTHSLKMAAEKVERELQKNYPGEVAALVMQKLRLLINSLNYNTYRKSLAIYVSPVFEKVLYFDLPVQESISVDDSFRVRDLVYHKKQAEQCLVLLISRNKSSLYAGRAGSFVKMISTAPVNDHVNAGGTERVLDNFLRQTDTSLGLLLGCYNLPLFIAAPPDILVDFRRITKYAAAVIDYIPGSYADAPAQQLAEIVKPYITPWEKVKERWLVSQLEKAAADKLLAAGMRDVWIAAKANKGRLLLLEKDYPLTPWQGAKKGLVYMPASPYNQFSNIKDAVDDVIEKVLEAGGDVEFVDRDILKDHHHIALLKHQ